MNLFGKKARSSLGVAWQPCYKDDSFPDGAAELIEVKQAATGVMELLYSRRYAEFSDALGLNPDLLQHGECPYCDKASDRPMMSSGSKDVVMSQYPCMSPFFLILLTKNRELTARTMQLIDSRDMWDCARCALFIMVDYCCSDLSCSADELQLARFFASLSRDHQDWCARLLKAEATPDSLTPLEFASVRDRFHLATAFANAPGYLLRTRDHPTDPRLSVEEIDLGCYAFDPPGDRLAKSPFIKLVNSAQPMLGDPIPTGQLCFFNSPISRAYFASISYLNSTRKSPILTFLWSLLLYIGLLTTLNVRIFTGNTFNASVRVRIPGLGGNASLSYLELVSPSFVAAFRYVFHARLCMQLLSTLGWVFWIGGLIACHYSVLPALRQTWPGMRWLAGALTMKGSVTEAISLLVVTMPVIILAFEQYFFLYPENSYFELDGRLFVNSKSFQVMVALNFFYMLRLQELFICDMALHFQSFLYIKYCMGASLKLTYLIFLPLILVCCTLLLSQPYVDCSQYSAACILDYLSLAFRYAFSLADFPGVDAYLTLWPQSVLFIYVSVFIVNFGIALLTQQISVLQDNVHFRQAINMTFSYSHPNGLSRLLFNRLLRRPARQRRVVMRRTLVRAKVSSIPEECETGTAAGAHCCLAGCSQSV